MELTNALWITLIGMGLVFIAILMLWGLMALLVRVTVAKEKPAPEATVDGEADAAVPVEEIGMLSDRRRRAAAAGVAAAMALQGRGAWPANSVQAGSALSAWQAVNRARGIGQRGNSSRNKVV